jgi:hypothetical protein
MPLKAHLASEKEAIYNMATYNKRGKMIRIQPTYKHINNAFILLDVRDFSALLPFPVST